jgi:iron complex transport system ATP-binding protein
MAEGLTIDGLTVAYGALKALDHVSLAIPPGRITVLAGPNGCGKSTLLRAVRRLNEIETGRVLFGDIDVARLGPKEIARAIGLLAQSPQAPEDMLVEELVRLGRYPHQSLLQPWSPEDAAAVEAALAGTGITPLRARRLGTLSGGQLQRVWIAMVLAQETGIVCLDEPINHLDMAHQIDCLDLVARLNREHGRTIVLVLHDLNLAARYADLLVFMKHGRIVRAGTPEELMTAGLIEAVFDIGCEIIRDPVHGRPLCIPRRVTAPIEA